jgi:hypothetical protein
MNFRAPHHIRLRPQGRTSEPDVHRNFQNNSLLYLFFTIPFSANSCAFRARHAFCFNKTINYRRLKPSSTSSPCLLVWGKESLYGYHLTVLEISEVLKPTLNSQRGQIFSEACFHCSANIFKFLFS